MNSATFEISSTTAQLLNKYSIDLSGLDKIRLKDEFEKIQSALLIKLEPLTKELMNLLQSIKSEKRTLTHFHLVYEITTNSKQRQLDRNRDFKDHYAVYFESGFIPRGGNFEAYLNKKCKEELPKTQAELDEIDLELPSQEAKIQQLQKEFFNKSGEEAETYLEMQEDLAEFKKLIKNLAKSLSYDNWRPTKAESTCLCYAAEHIHQNLKKRLTPVSLDVSSAVQKVFNSALSEKLELTEVVNSLWKKINGYFKKNEELTYSADNKAILLSEDQGNLWLKMSLHYQLYSYITL